jgi:hypothetical protein
MHARYVYGFGSIWATWSLDRLFIVDEIIDATKQKVKRKTERPEKVKPKEN